MGDFYRWHRTRRDSKWLKKPYQYSKIIPGLNGRLQHKRENLGAMNKVFIHSFIHQEKRASPGYLLPLVLLPSEYCPSLHSATLKTSDRPRHHDQSWAGVGVVSNAKDAFQGQPAWIWIPAFPFTGSATSKVTRLFWISIFLSVKWRTTKIAIKWLHKILALHELICMRYLEQVILVTTQQW